jgi:hypothetical protein
MRHPQFVFVCLCLVMTGASLALAQRQVPPPNRQCLHDQLETRTERNRREKALDVADAINRAQGMARRFGARPDGAYLPLDQLFNVPEPPDGFRVQLHTDGSTYSFSIKDTRDPCGYAVFSDQNLDIYEAIPSPPRVGPKLLSAK